MVTNTSMTTTNAARIDALPHDAATLMAVVEATGDATLGEVTVHDALRSLHGRKLTRALKAAEAVQPKVADAPAVVNVMATSTSRR